MSDATSTCGEVDLVVSSAEAVSIADDSGDAPPPSADASCAGERSEGVVESLEAMFSKLEVGGAALLQKGVAPVAKPVPLLNLGIQLYKISVRDLGIHCTGGTAQKCICAYCLSSDMFAFRPEIVITELH